MDERIGAEMVRWNVKGVSVAIVNDQHVIQAKGYGSADAAHAVAASPDTLAAQLPGFSIHDRFTDTRAITVRSMLAHHSGLPSNIVKGSCEPLGSSWIETMAPLESIPKKQEDRGSTRCAGKLVN